MEHLSPRRAPFVVPCNSNRLLYGLVAAGGGLVVVVAFIAIRMWFLGAAEGWVSKPEEFSAYLMLACLVVGAFALLGQHFGRHEDELRRLSSIDDLTGLFNRRHFDARVEQELARAIRYGFPLSVALIDVDELKRINDSFGHRSGDEALRRVAGALAAYVRSADVPARFGGDEFALLLPHTSVSEAEALAHRIRTAIGATPPGALFRVTVSIGLAGVERANEVGPDQLLEAADRALLRVKREGRDGVALDGETSSRIARLKRGRDHPPQLVLRD